MLWGSVLSWRGLTWSGQESSGEHGIGLDHGGESYMGQLDIIVVEAPTPMARMVQWSVTATSTLRTVVRTMSLALFQNLFAFAPKTFRTIPQTPNPRNLLFF